MPPESAWSVRGACGTSVVPARGVERPSVAKSTGAGGLSSGGRGRKCYPTLRLPVLDGGAGLAGLAARLALSASIRSMICVLGASAGSSVIS